MIAKLVSVRVSFLVMMSVLANPSAASSTNSAAGWNVVKPGRRITSMPMRPSTTAPMRLAVKRSPSTGTASSSGQAGAVNSSANTVASGNSSRLVAHTYCDAR